MIQSICIVRLSALGDVLMLVPLVRTLQKHFPHAAITWVISQPAASLVEGMDGVEFIVIDKPKSLQDYWRFRSLMRARSFDVLLAPQASFRANLLYPLISARRKIGYDALRGKDGHRWFIHETVEPGREHTLESFLKFAKALGVSEYDIRWDLPITEEARAFAEAHLPKDRPILLVNPAASKPERTWPLARYIETIRRAQAQFNVNVVLTGGPGALERDMADAIASEVPVTNLVGKTRPPLLLAVIAAGDVMLCPDTGPSHMAAAVNTPVVALHAVTSSEVSGPYTFRHLAVDCYPEAVIKVLKKTPETCPWGTHAHGEKTMELVSVDAVMGKLEKAFAEAAAKPASASVKAPG